MIREPTAIISQLTNVRSVAEVSTHGVDGSFGGVQLSTKLVKTLGISAMQDESAGLGAERLSNGLTQSTGRSEERRVGKESTSRGGPELSRKAERTRAKPVTANTLSSVNRVCSTSNI